MNTKMMMIATLSLGMGTGMALAQTAPATEGMGATTGSVTALPMGWEGNIGDAFFDDTETGTLRSDADINANWTTLSPEDQATVRDYCAQFGQDAAGADTMDATGTTGATTGATATGEAGATTGVGAGGTGAGTGDAATGAVTGTAGGDATGEVPPTSPSTTDTGVAGTDAQVDTMEDDATDTGSYHASIQQICDTVDTM